MKKTTIMILFLITGICANGQNNTGGSSISGGFKIKSKTTKGHQFLLKKWVTGYLVDNSGKLSEKKLLNYDIYNNNPTFKASNDQTDIMVIDKNLYSGFILSDNNRKKYIFSKIEGSSFKKGKRGAKYYELINAPKKTILLESYKVLKDPNSHGFVPTSTNSTKAGKFVLKTAVYVLNKQNKYVKVKLSSSSISKALKDKKKEIRSFIKQRGLKIKKASDLILIVDYYYSL